MSEAEICPEQPVLADPVPQEAEEQDDDDEDDVVDEEEEEDNNTNDATGEVVKKKKKTRRSRRGGYRRKRQQQKKVAALMAEAAAKRARAKAAEGDDSASTATTEEESSSCESTNGSSYYKAPQRAVARKKNAGAYRRPHHYHQQAAPMYQQQQQQYHPGYYHQGPMHAVPPMYPGGYGYPPMGHAPRSKKWKRSRFLTKGECEHYIALDCEMVGVGEHGAHSALARVTLVNWNGNIVMDELVKPQWEVSDYRTFVSGITKEMLDNATMDLGTARNLVLQHLQGKILVGHGLKNDLHVLGITHPWHMIRDTAKYEPFMKVRMDGCLWPRSLKDLVAEKLGKAIQVYGRPHCPKEDAVAALDLYKLVWRQWEKSMEYKMSRPAWAMQPQPLPAM